MSNESALAIANGSPPPIAPEVPPTTPSTPPPDQLKSNAFSHLAKKEKDLQRERAQLKVEKEKVDSINKQYQEYLELKKTDPIAALKNLGFTETDVFNYMSANAPVELTPEQRAAQAAEAAADAKIKSFEEAQTKRDKEAQNKLDQSVIQGYRNSVKQAIKADPAKFEYCAYNGSVAEELIYETVLQIVQASHGKDVPTPAEAAAMVEEYYEEQDRLMMTLKKRQPKAAPAPLPQKQPERTRTVSPPAQAPALPPRTLNGRATATVASTTKMTETFAQKKERLIERLKNGV